MKTEFLQNFKVGDQALPKEIIDEILAENGRDIEAAKKPFVDYQSIKEQLEEAKKALKAFEGVDASQLQAKIKELQGQLTSKDKEWQEKLDGMAFEGKLKDGLDAFDAIESLLPAGTLSGAPKIRACEIIEELERTPRGVYGGALGYVDFNGNLDTCIAIRMAVKKNDKVYVQAGAGIVADSVPESEYEETYNKALAVMNAVKNAGEVNAL